METLFSTELTIPLYQLALVLLFGAGLLCFGRVKLGMLANLLFMFYWGYWLNRDVIFGPGITAISAYNFCVYGFSALVCALAIIGFFHDPS